MKLFKKCHHVRRDINVAYGFARCRKCGKLFSISFSYLPVYDGDGDALRWIEVIL